jgi:hypothetical protein
MDTASAGFLQRAVTQQQGDIRVTAAVPDAVETEALTGLDLYAQDIQPVWLRIENTGPAPARFIPWSLDPNYFSPIEVAYMNRGPFSKQGYADMERWFHNNAMPRRIPPGESRSGLVFTQFKPGTKGFNLDIVQNLASNSFTFFIPIPGFVADYTQVDFKNLYSPAEIRELDEAQLQTVLEEELGCCTSDRGGEHQGGPVNAVIVATPLALRRSLLRGNWVETRAEGNPDLPIIRMAREQQLFGRGPDAVFSQHRKKGNVTVIVQFWMAPWAVASEPVWLAQVFYWNGEESPILNLLSKNLSENSQLLAFFIRESVMSDLDSAQSYLFQNLWYGGHLQKLGYVKGVGEASVETPHVTHGGVAYFTRGYRVVAFLSEDPIALNDTRLIYYRLPQLVDPGVSQ